MCVCVSRYVALIARYQRAAEGDHRPTSVVGSAQTPVLRTVDSNSQQQAPSHLRSYSAYANQPRLHVLDFDTCLLPCSEAGSPQAGPPTRALLFDMICHRKNFWREVLQACGLNGSRWSGAFRHMLSCLLARLQAVMVGPQLLKALWTLSELQLLSPQLPLPNLQPSSNGYPQHTRRLLQYQLQ